MERPLLLASLAVAPSTTEYLLVVRTQSFEAGVVTTLLGLPALSSALSGHSIRRLYHGLSHCVSIWWF